MILYTEIDICQEKSPLFPEKKADGRAFSSIRIPSPRKKKCERRLQRLTGRGNIQKGGGAAGVPSENPKGDV